MAEYYAQRASAGLIIAEGTNISPQGRGYAFTPGLYDPSQVTALRQVTEAMQQPRARFRAAVACRPQFTTIAETNLAHLIAFGRASIANPDLAERLRLHAPLNVPQRETFFGGSAHGYTD
ncbi:MAG TPA: hypothetical protein VI653_10395 [Steroidobacteraceae bacterium]